MSRYFIGQLRAVPRYDAALDRIIARFEEWDGGRWVEAEHDWLPKAPDHGCAYPL